LVEFSPKNIVVKDGYCIICLTKTGATGFSGAVPVDQGTTVIKRDKFGIGDAVPGINYFNQQKPVFVSLDGRMVQQGITGSTAASKTSAGLWVTKRNNSGSVYLNMGK
jgi:hypothetical protein